MTRVKLMLFVAVAVGAGVTGFSAVAAGPNSFESGAVSGFHSRIDELVFARQQRLGIQPANLCSDTVFVRRVYLDAIGTLPTALEAKNFILDAAPNKRARLIDHLLERKEFADYWAMKWGDLLRIKAEFPINLWPNAAQGYHHWLRTCLRDNLPYDRFARDLLTPNGSNFEVPPVNFYRALPNKDPQGIARAVALTLMGTRVENWPSNQWADLAVFFSEVSYKSTSEWKEEIVFFSEDSTNAGALARDPRPARFPDGTPALLVPGKDPRQIFADWLIDPKNPWFTCNIANRVWSWLLGRGIIHEPDDIRPDNPPSNPELLRYLEEELVSSGYDLKHLYRLILNSETYQLSSIPRDTRPEAAAQFAFYPARRLDAEVLIDALNQLTGSKENYSSAIPEPYTFMPEGQRSISLPDGSISSAFLELFGRPPRDTGREAERNNRITAAQSLHLLNSSHIQRKIQQSRMIDYQMESKKTPRDIAIAFYLGILSRYPTVDELRIAEAYFQSGKVKPREAAVDLAWALINSAEFLYRH